MSAYPSPNASSPADVAQAVAALSRRLGDFAGSVTASLLSGAITSVDAGIPEFHGFNDDPVSWLQTLNDFAARHAWPEHVTRSFAEDHLCDTARAWNLYDGHTHSTWASLSGALVAAFGDLPGSYDDRFMQMRARRQGPGEDVATYAYDKLRLLTGCDLVWGSPGARQYVLDGLAYHVHATILTVQTPCSSPEAFIRRAKELQQGATLRLLTATAASVAQLGLATSHTPAMNLPQSRVCFSCGRPGHSRKVCPASRFQMRYQVHSLPMLQVHIDGIGDVKALVDTGAQRTALHRRHVPDDAMKPWTQPPLRGLGGLCFASRSI